MKDQETDQCKRCGIEFSVKRRKHHCRRCGLIVCDSCSKNRIQLKKNGKKSRVCNECFNQIAPRHMRSISSKRDEETLSNDDMFDPNTNSPPIIHEQATTEEVEYIIENLRQAAIKQKQENELRNKHDSMPSAASSASWIRTDNFPERTNTDGTFVEYQIKHKDKDNDDEQQLEKSLLNSIDTDGSNDSASQPLLNNSQSECCSCIIV